MAQIFYYDEGVLAKFQQEKPWVNDTHFFKRVEISALALLKKVVHVRLGDTFEVIGLMQGKTDVDAIIVRDASVLPVEGTETRIHAQADAYEYMVDYSQTTSRCVLVRARILACSYVEEDEQHACSKKFARINVQIKFTARWAKNAGTRREKKWLPLK